MGLFAVVDDLNFCPRWRLYIKQRKYPSECVGQYNKHTKKEKKKIYREKKRGTETERESKRLPDTETL